MPGAILEIIPTTADHIRELGASLRKEDEREVLSLGFNLRRTLWRTYRASVLTKTAFIDGKLAAIWGLGGTPMGHVGQPWLLTTAAVNRVSPLQFVRIYQQEVETMRGLFPVLVNWVDARYNAAIRLLDIIGFQLGDPQNLGVNNEMFIRFSMGEKHDAA